ncbi:putative carbohydrate kinase [Actinacidiphila reveromycinica]|uniref:Putative carbohydrate kinase n=1 Tax=Actinacidiphila reveromycinica TaxID=659352 RepID=A0A7U3VQK2_9ACTN|nr:sugar kinase [Streptomyces sp. SN-593]BBA99763.1 putative carbohydrate kinase [Streptomyces sp. SN-593]
MIATPSAERVEVVCLGESMVTFVPSRPGPLADVPSFHRAIGGAESNVACTLARAGHRTRWVSRVGADGFGDHLVDTIAAAGVDVGAVQRDPHRPTGVYFRTAQERSTTLSGGSGRAEVVYYRKGSAASALSPDLVRRQDVWSGDVLHLTGITGALSATCHALMTRLTHREPGRPLVSFDVNHRPALWRDADPLDLVALARGCDLVFVGEDEAQAAFGLPDADAVRAALPEPAVLVVKQGADGATVFASEGALLPGGPGASGAPGAPEGAAASQGVDGPVGPDRAVGSDRPGAVGGGDVRLHVPAPVVDVVAHVGAGDAFAAGFLSATLRGLPLRDRMRHGHLLAAAALTVPDDLAVPPGRERCDALAALDDAAWGALRLGPGWARDATGGGTP